MSEVFSIQVSKHGTDRHVWLDLPATREQVAAAMGQIGVTQDNPWDYSVTGFSTPEGRHLAIPYDLAMASGVNELNFLAARLEKLDAYEIGTLNAALQQKNTELRTISRIIDYPDNLDYYVNLPDIHTVAALGDYYLNRSGMVDMPDEWKPAIDTAALGKHIAGLEQGAFTEYGYIVKSGDQWRQVYEGQPVPEEYRVLSFPPPQVERDEASRPQPQPEQTAPASQPVIPIVLTGRNNAERMKEITDKLEAGIQALFESERYKNYLTAMSKFHNYSFNNTLLIAMQKPDASLVAGYNKWKDEFERHVKRGEKAIKILAPAPYKVRRQVEKLDTSGKTIPGPDGKPLTEEQEVTVPAFKVVSVFDVSQTEGREIPDIAVDELTGSVERYQDFFAALERTSPVPIAFENIESGAHGYYHLEEKRIAIDEGMSELQNLKTAIHEIAHATLHAIDKDATPEELADRPDRRTREVQAESVAYAVCQHYGLDTSDYSFGYVAGWSSGKDLSELKASLETIRATANDLITKIDGHLAQLQQEREARQEQAPAIWNGLDGLINDKPFMPGATPEQQANALIDFAERDGQRLGNGERRLIVDYANVIRDYHKVADLINELCEDGFEIQHGHVDASVQMRVEREIAEAPPILLDPDAEPLVTVIWSESADLRDGEQMPLSQADAVFKALDDAMKNEPGYDKTKFRIDFTMNGKADNYEGRQDFGDGDGSLIEHIQGYHEYYAQDESWKNHVLHHEGPEAWEADKAERDMILGEFIPYLKLHCNLSAMEREAQRPLQSGETLPPEQVAYFNAVLDYVRQCRPLLNQGQYQLPEPPRLADFDVDLQEYKAHVMDEIQREAAAAGMTVEEYAANGYEPAAQPEAAQTTDTPQPESSVPEKVDTPEPPGPVLTELEKKAVEIAKGYEKLPLQERIDVIARTFGCTTGKIETSPCRGKWRGTSDISIRFDNGASLAIGNYRTPKAKTVKVQSECVNAVLVRYNPEIVQATKEAATAALLRKEEKDNAIAAQRGLKPYTFLNVELHDGADNKSGYMGWYYVTLAVDGKICTHLETGLAHDIASGKVSDTPTREDYFTAGALKEDQVDYVMNNVGFSSTSDLYSLPLHDDVRERAERTLAEREAQAAPPTVEPTPEGISAELYDLMCAYDPEFMKNYENRDDQIGGTIREMQAVGPTSFELVIVGIRDDEQAPAALRERAAALMDTIDRYKELNNTFSIYQIRGGPETRDFRFEPYYRLLATGRTVDPTNYDLVYTAPLRDTDTLESIYRQFNTDHPADFKGHSLSVSDVVVLRHGDRQEAHFCDDVGFREVPEFLRENPLRTAELSTEQNENMIDGVLNNAPSPGEVEAKEEAGEPVAEQPPQTDAPEQTAVHYYTINEGAARRAKVANSFDDYRPGSATAEYRRMVDKAVEIAQRQKKRVDPEFHDKIDQLLDTYARLLAQNMNKGYEIAARVPSVMIAGPANFPVKKKQKQNAADDKNMREWQDIQGLLDKIRSTGMGGISADDPNAIEKLQAKLEKLEATQEMMKAVNAYYRKHKTLEGCPHLTQKSIEAFQSGMAGGGGGSPFLPWQLSNNNANIRQVRSRIEQLTRQRENVFVGWEFDGGTVEINREANRLQIFFEGKPDEATRNILKENSFRWSPKAGAWQRQLNDNTFWVVDRIAFLRPLSGEKPSELQAKARKAQEKPSIRAQLKAAKEGQQPKAPTKDKSQDLEV
ncbi:LPD25 domain-containing protein [uncultured Oscillibacter sp.]|uniref:LPD25 domain-containing protein n=1 Tax=uncultured Oscillibacter sp. TaxID=876091 RepID=UPI00260B7463|nr:LPD25 domain-containing protein [uncultured Oscillibacter sp.]